MERFHPHETQVRGVSSKTENWRRQWNHMNFSFDKIYVGSRNQDSKRYSN